MKPGTVTEYWTSDSPTRNTQHQRVVKPKCANTGQLDRAGECDCAPDPNSPEVIAYREAQAKLNKQPRLKPLDVRIAPLSETPVPKPARVVKSKASKKTKRIQKSKAKKQTRGRK